MKSSILYLILLTSYCYGEQLLGGWSTSEDESLKRDCLNKALVQINGAEVTDQIRSEASDVICKTQIVNGLNIKCSFVSQGQKWRCSYYKSFIQTLETQLEQCKQVQDEDKSEQKENQQVAVNQGTSNDGQKIDEQAVEDQGTSNEDQKQEQPLAVNVNEEVKQPASLIESDEESQVFQKPPSSNNNEQDDEAAIDVMSRKLSEQLSNNEGEQQETK